jgi:beta-N-acetylhexosaminidase
MSQGLTKVLPACALLGLAGCKNLPAGSSGKEALDRRVDELMTQMTLEEKVGQVLLPALRRFNDGEIRELTPEMEKTLRDCHPSGVIFFKNCFFDASQTRHLVAAVRSATLSPSGLPPFLGVDQEGGRVVRISFLPATPMMREIGDSGDPGQCEAVASRIAKDLARLGLNTNFAPVLDVNSNPLNPVIGDRAFGNDPKLVGKMGIAYIAATRRHGVIPVGKHFPGHGDTSTDSHEQLPVVALSEKEIRDIHLAPFRQAIDHGLEMIMTAHVQVPALDPTRMKAPKTGAEIGMPATLSHRILTDLLRHDMKFAGVVTTDAMDMKAIADNFGEAEGAILALKAGADLILMPAFIEPPSDANTGFASVYHRLVDAAKSGEIPAARLDEAVTRIVRLKLSTLCQPQVP